MRFNFEVLRSKTSFRFKGDSKRSVAVKNQGESLVKKTVGARRRRVTRRRTRSPKQELRAVRRIPPLRE
jgi:hypothetical protein